MESVIKTTNAITYHREVKLYVPKNTFSLYNQDRHPYPAVVRLNRSELFMQKFLRSDGNIS